MPPGKEQSLNDIQMDSIGFYRHMWGSGRGGWCFRVSLGAAAGTPAGLSLASGIARL